MNFKEFNESLIVTESEQKIKASLLMHNQIVKFPKIGWIIPYSLAFKRDINETTIKTLNDNLTIPDPYVIQKDKFQAMLEEVSYRLSKLGFRKQNQKILFMSFIATNKYFIEKHWNVRAINPNLFGFYIEKSDTIFINKNAYPLNSKAYISGLIHEIAHAIWIKLPKETKDHFITTLQNYQTIAAKKYYSQYTEKQPLTNKEKQIVSKQFKENLTNNLQKDVNLIIDIISTAINNTYNIPTSTVKSQISRKILMIVRNNPKILYTNINKLLNDITVTKQIDNDEESIKSHIVQKGIMPSSYSLKNHEESFSELISYAAEDITKIPKELKNLLIGIISKII
jgi:hypothetical protein